MFSTANRGKFQEVHFHIAKHTCECDVFPNIVEELPDLLVWMSGQMPGVDTRSQPSLRRKEIRLYTLLDGKVLLNPDEMPADFRINLSNAEVEGTDEGDPERLEWRVFLQLMFPRARAILPPP
ncbi:hypothetical protein PAAG_04624 [Paracoccidioides lutzii Pb01]|uniref:Uncharacterized protein n=1 Tax=Paracoccidioides lutzii (strain ATCC MYA-826 / Pb01) TaxID=502779 RepID=C1H1I0_PARBA|nr:hypothetical protein PAAG_04624 [Paracoccidioides lutzii Pb01]EEH33574.2 hypothetical protein PAAG_04624 [Paracoccidioides lutzii Pb01]